jgi:hypothetical protein
LPFVLLDAKLVTLGAVPDIIGGIDTFWQLSFQVLFWQFSGRIKSAGAGVTKLSSTVQIGSVLPKSLARGWVLLVEKSFREKARVTGDYSPATAYEKRRWKNGSLLIRK